MARSMNGINNIEVNNIEFPDGSTISSASNLVQLDTNNVFTGNTAYENNLPTSNVNPLVGDINNNTMLNKFSADKLYIGNDEISECFNGASITGRDITLTRVDGENDEVIAIPETSLSTCVLKTTDQEIDGEKTFVDFPKIKLDENNNTPNPTANNQLATKKYVDDNAGGSTPTNMVTTDTTQVISGLKQFSNQRPKALSSATTTTATSQELITKGDADSFYAPKNTIHGFSQKQHTNDDQIKNVVRGNPQDTNPNSHGGLIHSFLTCYVNTYDGDYEGVSLDFSVVGEWNNFEYDKGVAIARARYVNGNYAYDTILRAPANSSSARYIQNFNISYHTDKNSTMESCNGKYIDLTIENDNLYSYTIVLVNSSTHTTNHDFYLNRTVSGTGQRPYERGTSCITAQLFN